MHNSSCFSFQFYIKPQPTMRGCTAMHSCFSFQFYIKPQLVLPATSIVSCCFSFQFYIKPQRKRQDDAGKGVVSHSNSTSNHNSVLRRTLPHYVVSHSNSTSNHNLHVAAFARKRRCFSFQFYIKPQHAIQIGCKKYVVSHSNSTSNHNFDSHDDVHIPLFLIPILHQTTTECRRVRKLDKLFLIPILHQTTTSLNFRPTDLMLFLIPILHQTTTVHVGTGGGGSLFLIPILHQTTTRGAKDHDEAAVVSHSNSTSNHNLAHGSNSYSARYTYDTDA